MSDQSLRELERAHKATPDDVALQERLRATQLRADPEVAVFDAGLRALIRSQALASWIYKTQVSVDESTAIANEAALALEESKLLYHVSIYLRGLSPDTAMLRTFTPDPPSQIERFVVAFGVYAKTKGGVPVDLISPIERLADGYWIGGDADVMLTIGVAFRVAACVTEHATRSFQIAFNQPNFINTGVRARSATIPGYLRRWAAQTKGKKVVRARLDAVDRWLDFHAVGPIR